MLFLIISLLTTFSKSESILSTNIHVKSSLKMSSIRVLHTTHSKSKIKLRNFNGETTIKNTGERFKISKDRQKASLKISATSLSTKEKTEFYAGLNVDRDLVIDKRRQWLLAYSSEFFKYKKEVLTVCGPYKVLGGHCVSSTKELKESFDLPEHRFVRIVLNFHFIDNWEGETGYIKVSPRIK